MMKLEECAKLLNSFILANYPNGDGMSTRNMTEFYLAHPATKERIQNRRLRKLINDFPHLLYLRKNNNDDDDDDDSDLVVARADATVLDRRHDQRVDRVAYQFYNDVLRDNPYLRRRCEDRNRFDQELSAWKDAERQKGRYHTGCCPSSLIRSLKTTWSVIEAVHEGSVIVWSSSSLEEEGGKEEEEDEGHNGGDVAVPRRRRRDARVKDAANRVRDARSVMERNRGGVCVGDVLLLSSEDDIACVGTVLERNVTVASNSRRVSVTVKAEMARKKGVKVSGPGNCDSFDLSVGESEVIKLSYTPTVFGVMRSIIVFDIVAGGGGGDDDADERFSITRYLSVRAGDPADQDVLKPTSEYKRKKKMEKGAFTDPTLLTPEERDDDGGNFLSKYVTDLKKYGIPMHWRDSMVSDNVQDQILGLYYYSSENGPDPPPENEDGGNSIPSNLSQYLCLDNYSSIFRRLLWTEEVQCEIDIKNYDIFNTVLIRTGRRLALNVPGLAESRPSVMRGDTLLLRRSVKGDKKCYEGYVERVHLEDVILKLPRAFENAYVNGDKVDVRFRFKRTGFRTAHQALDSILMTVIDSRTGQQENSSFLSMMEDMLFPGVPPESGSDGTLSPLNEVISSPDKLKLFNRDLNKEQRTAVYGALRSVARPSPYLIYGPPGTGKTVTLVESILQTLFAKGASTNTKLLVCAPSNTATDLLVQRLSPHLSPLTDMMRLIAYTRDKKSVPPDVLKYAKYSEDQQGFYTPSTEQIKRVRVVAMTLAYAAKLSNLGVTNHFTHVFIDEAGHAIEPDAISCFVNVTKSTPAIVLAGDPQQLGPIVRSDVAKPLGLEQSLLERLSKRTAYQRRDNADEISYDSRIITKLVRNYRSHPAILKLPNDSFYDSALVASADPLRTHCFVKWEHLPSPSFPLIFHGVQGDDRREGNSPSWFNADEATIVKHYVELLTKDTKRNRCSPEDIGIVTPYHKQAQKIKTLLRTHNHEQCKVGSVDEFQGSERRVIIISTVRSSVEYVDFDARHRLGFVAHPKRFNVAITRAQALLIVVGNPYVLSKDECWNDFIRYCRDNGGYTGCDYEPEETTALDTTTLDTIESLAAMNINDGDERNDDAGKQQQNGDFVVVSNTTAQEGPEWRFEE